MWAISETRSGEQRRRAKMRETNRRRTKMNEMNRRCVLQVRRVQVSRRGGKCVRDEHEEGKDEWGRGR